MKIAYLMNIYPYKSTTFIRREILALERAGFNVNRIALRGWYGDLVEEDKPERGRTRYVLKKGAPALLMAVMRMMFTQPFNLLRALALAIHMGRRSYRPLTVHLAYLAEACLILPWLRQEGIDHLHTHFGTNSAEVAMLAHVLGGPLWSFTVHGPEEFDRRPLIGLTEKIQRCKFVVAISSFGRSQLYRCVEPKYWRKVQVVHCGLEPAVFAAANSPAITVRRLVCVGRLGEQKGHLLLLEAARLLAAEGEDFELVLVGDGELRADIETLISDNNLQERVRITGWVADRQVREEILAARALVLPSFAEGLPVVIMEAMALKRPIISTFVAGIPELVRAGEHGWLVPAGDVEALANAMRNCLEAPLETLVRMGEAAQKSVLLHHSIDTEVAKLAKLFETEIIPE